MSADLKYDVHEPEFIQEYSAAIQHTLHKTHKNILQFLDQIRALKTDKKSDKVQCSEARTNDKQD